MLEQYILLWCVILLFLGLIGILYPVVSFTAFFLGLLTLVVNGVIIDTTDVFLRNVGVGVLFLDAICSILGVAYRWSN